MKPAGLLFLVPAGLACMAQGEEPATGLLSSETKAHIRAGLPAFEPKPVNSEPNTGTASDSTLPASDPNLFVLPTLTVKEKRLPADATRHLMSPKDYRRKMSNLYLDEVDRLGPLNSFLNSFTIPLLSPSRAERGKAIELNRELDRLSSLLSGPDAKMLNDFYDQLAATNGSIASPRR